MSDPMQRPESNGGAASLARLLELGLFLRVATALAVEWYVRRGELPRVCVFPDAESYWTLAGTIREGRTFEIVEWGDIPHFALRTPGYPLFLAVCRAVSGDRPLAARLVQSVLGALTVWLVYRLTREVIGVSTQAAEARKGWSVPLVAAAFTAVHPYFLVTSALLLSEAVFVPLMVGTLWGVAVLWGRIRGDRGPAGPRGLLLPLSVGAGSGAAILVRPSWALFVPLMIGGLLSGIVLARRSTPARAASRAGLVGAIVIGAIAVMAPWWIRNAGIFGRFVPTAVWMGASLYDGLSPEATGSSDMRFLADPEFWPLDELDQDRRFTRRALEFAAAHPRRVLELAVVKLCKFWCPWPVAQGVSSWPLIAFGAMVASPLLAMIGLGLWERRLDPRAWLLLAGPLLYFCGVHMIFASSMRYRIPGEVPAMGLAAVGLARLLAAPVRPVA